MRLGLTLYVSATTYTQEKTCMAGVVAPGYGRRCSPRCGDIRNRVAPQRKFRRMMRVIMRSVVEITTRRALFLDHLFYIADLFLNFADDLFCRTLGFEVGIIGGAADSLFDSALHLVDLPLNLVFGAVFHDYPPGLVYVSNGAA